MLLVVVIGMAVWVATALLVVALCAMAARGDRQSLLMVSGVCPGERRTRRHATARKVRRPIEPIV
jgi:hypothetical protein